VPTTAQRSPTTGLLFGLIITLAAVVAYSFYIRVQLSGLRKLQSEMVDRNRKDSLQLLRVQNDLNSIGLAMRDMLDASEPYPLTAWSAQFERIRDDLDVALHLEEQLSGANRTPEQRKYLSQSVAQFWDAVNRMFSLAAQGNEKEAREQIRLTLQARQESLSTAVSRLLVQNNEGEEEAAARIAGIYAKADFDSGIDAAKYFAGVARRIRTSADGDRLAAGARWKPSARRLESARRSAGSTRNRAIDAG
jgi:hypothetical protein